MRVSSLAFRSCTNSIPRLGGNCTRFAELLDEHQTRKDVLIQGWVQRSQNYAKKLFLKLNDGTSPHQIQAIVPRDICRTIWVGSAVQLRGKWIQSQGSEQEMEFLAEECIVMGHSMEQKPLMGDNEVLRQLPHLRPKTGPFAAVLRIRSHLTHFTHNFFNAASFFHVDTPVISQNDCEGAGETFSIARQPDNAHFFGENKPFLQVSGQLHLEAISSAIPRIYTLGPAFRADINNSRYNMAEFRMLEAECAFMDSLDRLCDVIETYLKYVVDQANEHLQDEFRACASICERDFDKHSSKILAECMANKFEHPLPRITFVDAMKIVRQDEAISDLPKIRPLSRQEELKLVDVFRGPLFVTHFPAQHKPFYMRRDEDEGDGQMTESFDLLAPFVGELAGGSVREWDLAKLAKRLPTGGKLDWYLELRRRGYPRSAGFGLGFDRLMQTMIGIQNIRDTIPFPRWHSHLRC